MLKSTCAPAAVLGNFFNIETLGGFSFVMMMLQPCSSDVKLCNRGQT